MQISVALLCGTGLLASLSVVPVNAWAGWYLLEPPVFVKKDAKEDDPKGFVFATDAPLSQWYRKGVFDAAKECTAARAAYIEEQRTSLRQTVQYEKKALWLSFSRAALASAQASECVASDDRRLLQ
jgi:hypothetical protein